VQTSKNTDAPFIRTLEKPVGSGKKIADELETLLLT
jgi:hypothetical protein